MARFKSEYFVGKSVGEGGHGQVYSGFRKSDKKEVIIKQIYKSKSDKGTPVEVEMMKSLENVAGVCRVIEWYENPNDYIIIMEKMENAVDLFDFISERGDKISESESLIIFKNIFRIVLDIDEQNFVHRDLKPENILIDKITLKTTLIDFDSCTAKQDAPFTKFNGTAMFYPPEWYINNMCSAEQMTVWSLGLILYNMITGDIPFSKPSDIINIEPDYNKFSSAIGDLIRCMLIKEERYRYGFEDIRLALNM